MVAILVVFSSALVWACGDDDEDEAERPAATSPAGEIMDADESPEAREDGGEAADLAGRFGEATFKVTYELTVDGDGGMDDGTMTWYKKGDNLRIDIDSEIEGEQVTAIIIDRPDQSYFCTKIPGLAEGGTCLEAPGASGEGIGEIVGEVEGVLGDPDVDMVSIGSREIAGEDADCFRVTPPGSEGESEYCVSEDGVPLSINTTAAGVETSMEAVEFSSDVSDDDFEPPYPVGEDFLPGLDIDIDDIIEE
jgi:hypothetical protein